MTTPRDLLRRLVLAQAGLAAPWAGTALARLADGAPDRDLHLFLGFAPRRLGKADLELSEADRAEAEALRPGWRLDGWSLDGAARILGILSHKSERPFGAVFKDLRRTADAAELIALYRGLPLYPAPESLQFEAGEGLRSHMRAVFEAVAHANPFPREEFDDHRWNHMVLKALFVDSRLAPIQGLDARANPELARILCAYARERWAAGREVSPELWRCVGPFATEEPLLADLYRALSQGGAGARGAALALAASPALRARALLAGRPEAAEIAEGRLTWDRIGEAA